MQLFKKDGATPGGVVPIRAFEDEDIEDPRHVLVLEEPEGTHRFLITGAFVEVGACSECDIQIEHDDVDLHHLRVTPTGSGAIFEVIGEKPAFLEDGTELTSPVELPFLARVMFGVFSVHVTLLDSDGE